MPFAPARLIKLRTEAILTQRELAERAGVTLLSVHRIERGLQEPRPAMMRKIAKALKVRPQDLLESAS